MLRSLVIDHFALIDHLELDFAPGFTALTGETGAGKSLLIGALSFVLGGAADKDRITQGAQKGAVEALFEVADLPHIVLLLEQLGLPVEEGLLTLQREIHRTGRSVCRVGGVTVPLKTLSAIADQLVDLHGQHAHQSLLNEATHLDFLDRLGDKSHRDGATALSEAIRTYREMARTLAHASGDAAEHARQEDMLRFQIDELTAAHLAPDEERSLDAERATLRNADRISKLLRQVDTLLSGDADEGGGALDNLRQAAKVLSTLSPYGAPYANAHDALAEVAYATEGVSAQIAVLVESAQPDPERLSAVEARLDLFSKLRRKYGATTRDMLAFLEKATENLSTLQKSEANLSHLTFEHDRQQKAVFSMANTFSNQRKLLATAVQKRIEAELSDLGMAGARLVIQCTDENTLNARGLDEVRFLFSANIGMEPRPLSKVASGGELSRIMLALKCVEVAGDLVSTLIFDEIDTGIGGPMGRVVGEKLVITAQTHQVLCVTHLPQIAALARTQLQVAKSEKEGITRTTVVPLSMEQRVQAIATMLGGGVTAEGHARALLS